MTEHLTICVLTPDFIPVWSGIGSYTVGLLKHLPKDIDIHLITARRKIRSGNDRFGVTDKVMSERFGDNVTIHLASTAEDTFLYHAKFQLACFRIFPKLCKENNFSLLHTNFPLMPEIFLQIARRIHIPTISTIHTTIQGQHVAVKNATKTVLRLEQSDLANLFLRRPLRLCERVCLERSDRLVATSNYIKEELLRYYPFAHSKKVNVVHYGIDTELFSPSKVRSGVRFCDQDSSGKRTVLFTGRFVASKGGHTLIKAIPKIVKEVPDALFVFVGGGDPSFYINELERRNISRNSYVFPGYVHYFEMPEVYSAASVHVMPTLYESFPLRLLESMACETTTIASNICGIPEAITSGYNGILVPPENSEILANSTVELLQDEKTCSRLGRRARETIVNNFSVEVMAARTLAVYKDVA